MPDKGAAKAYGLLLNAMEESGRVAIARVDALQGAAGRDPPGHGDVLMMETMIFADEVVPTEEIDELPEAEDLKVSERELKMAQQLIDSLLADFEPEVQGRVPREGARADRAQGGRRGDRRPPEAPAPAKVPDLMAALEASLAAVKGDDAGARSPPGSRRARRSRSKS